MKRFTPPEVQNFKNLQVWDARWCDIDSEKFPKRIKVPPTPLVENCYILLKKIKANVKLNISNSTVMSSPS